MNGSGFGGNFASPGMCLRRRHAALRRTVENSSQTISPINFSYFDKMLLWSVSITPKKTEARQY
jgi:hypothetical protein